MLSLKTLSSMPRPRTAHRFRCRHSPRQWNRHRSFRQVPASPPVLSPSSPPPRPERCQHDLRLAQRQRVDDAVVGHGPQLLRHGLLLPATESGSRTASGQRSSQNAMTAAHRSLPFGTKLRVTHGGSSVIVTINDRGPFIRGRVLDLSTGAAPRHRPHRRRRRPRHRGSRLLKGATSASPTKRKSRHRPRTCERRDQFGRNKPAVLGDGGLFDSFVIARSAATKRNPELPPRRGFWIASLPLAMTGMDRSLTKSSAGRRRPRAFDCPSASGTPPASCANSPTDRNHAPISPGCGNGSGP